MAAVDVTSRGLVDPELFPLIDASPPIPADASMIQALRNRPRQTPTFDPSGVIVALSDQCGRAGMVLVAGVNEPQVES